MYSGTIYIAGDHRGVGMKLYLIEMLSASGYNVKNLGTDDPNIMIDYPEIAKKIADAILEDPSARGICICGFGGGVTIAANRYRHIRATRCLDPMLAAADREHDDTNVLCFGSEYTDLETAYICAEAFLETPFDAIERRIRRIKLMS